MGYMEIIIGGIFVNNILLAQFLGNCPFLGTSKKMETAVGMSMAVVFVLVMAGLITWVLYKVFLVPFQLVYMRTIVFILVIGFTIRRQQACYQRLPLAQLHRVFDCRVVSWKVSTSPKRVLLRFLSTLTAQLKPQHKDLRYAANRSTLQVSCKILCAGC